MERDTEVMTGLEISQIALFGGGLFLIGFFLFIIFYIILRILSERHEHVKIKMDKNRKIETDVREQKKPN
ncbi:MAG: hypothetical protein JSV56_10115 [Methanomassiliicoccales archaeon]|nr:MAG: hypothetical protein JSV56_10115 [Methanomassiliicoccales archaeon]